MSFRKLRVAVVTGAFPVASETFVVEHILGLLRHGFEPVVLAAEVDETRLQRLRAERGFEADVVAWRPHGVRRWCQALVALRRFRPPLDEFDPLVRGCARAAEALEPALRAVRADVVHAHFGPNGVAAALAAPRGVPVIADFHGYDFTELPASHGWSLYRHALRDAHIVAHSPYAVRCLTEALGREVRLVRLGIDLDTFNVPDRTESWPPIPTVACVGRLVPQKGQAVLLQALHLLRAGGPRVEFSLQLAGSGPELPRLRALATQLGVQNSVTFLGVLEPRRIATLYARAQVAVVPSLPARTGWREAFCLVAVEAMAAGLPVIASDTGGLRDTVAGVGVLVPPGDPEALAAQLRCLAAAPNPEGWARASRARAIEYGLDRMGDEYTQLTRATVGRP